MGEENQENHELPARREKFCQEYIKDFNATQAAIRAGYSEHTAAQIGYENLKKPQIQARIEELKAEELAAEKITGTRILQELSRIAMSDITEVAEWDEKKGVRLKPSSQLSADTRAGIAEVSQVKGKSPKKSVKMHDKVKALELLGKHKKLWMDHLQVSGALGVTVVDDVPSGK